ncbi:MAG: hypothetical protein AB7N71_09065, partial [Phycisphaerae bacterium]
ADLDTAQQELLDKVNAQIKAAEANLELAQQTAGSGNSRPQGSKAKLALVRLDGAKQAVPSIEAGLRKLPADAAERKETQEKFDALRNGIAQLEMRITGKSAEENEQADVGVKLDYRQEEQLKNARFTIREIQGMAESLAALVEKLKSSDNQDLIDHREVQAAAQTIIKAQGRIKQTEAYWSALPADGRGVQAAKDECAAASQRIADSSAYLAPIQQRLAALINPESYPDLAADTDRLGDLAGMYADTMIFQTDRGRAAGVLREARAAVAERDRIVEKYALLIHQQTPEGVRIGGTGNHFSEKYQQFAAEAEKWKGLLPEQIKADIAEARDIAKEAVEKQKPMFFTGGIPQQLATIDDKLTLYEVLNPDDGKKFAAEVAALRDELKKGEAALREQIVQSNNLPGDHYTKPDRDELIKLAIESWKEVQPDVQVLTARIPAKEWKREVLWRNQTGSWYKVDHSKLQVQLIVRHDDRLAVIRPMDLWKNHLSNDEVNAYRFYSIDEELQPSAYLLLSKLK